MSELFELLRLVALGSTGGFIGYAICKRLEKNAAPSESNPLSQNAQEREASAYWRGKAAGYEAGAVAMLHNGKPLTCYCSDCVAVRSRVKEMREAT